MGLTETRTKMVSPFKKATLIVSVQREKNREWKFSSKRETHFYQKHPTWFQKKKFEAFFLNFFLWKNHQRRNFQTHDEIFFRGKRFFVEN